MPTRVPRPQSAGPPPVVVVPPRELDVATRPDLEAALARALDSGRDVVVDLSAVEFCDAGAARVLSAAARAAARRGRALTVHDPARALTRVLRVLAA